MKQWLWLCLILSFTPNAQSRSLSAVLENNQGAKLLSEDRAYEAMQDLVEGLADSPFETEIHLNLGLAFEKQKELDKAISEYRTAAASTPDRSLKFAALFNMAHALGELKRVPEALAAYQGALEMVPNSKEVKTNIELLLAQGGGGGQGDEKKDSKDSQGENDKDKNKKDDQPKDQPKPNGQQPKEPPPQPKPFKSDDLSQSDVRKILDEIKNQEQKIRRKEYDKKAKEAPGGKDW
jgi:tetratricopeptide (TPR) repeat protein